MRIQMRLALLLASTGVLMASAQAGSATFTPQRPQSAVQLVQDQSNEASDDSSAGEADPDEDEEYSAFPKDFVYPRIPVKFPDNVVAPGLPEFLETLRGIVAKRDDAALIATVAPKIFWDRDFGGGFDETLGGVENFRNALQIGIPDILPEYADDGWKRLDGLLASGLFAAEEDYPGAYCTPVAPELVDEAAAEPTFKKVDMGDGDWQLQWGYIEGKTEARDKPAADGAVVATVENEAVPVYSWGIEENVDWVDVGLPDGRRAFVDTKRVGSWVNERICLGKEGDAWKIVGYMGGGD